MKTLVISALAALATLPAFAAAPATPTDDASSSKRALTSFTHKTYMSTSRANRLNVIIVKQEAEPVQVRILNDMQEVVYRTDIKEDSVLKPFNLTHLDPGTYTLELRRGEQVVSEPVQVR